MSATKRVPHWTRPDPAAKVGNKEIAIVHVAKKQLCLDDDTYRMTLRRVGVESSKNLTQAQYRELMAHYEHCGFKVEPKTKKGVRRGRFKVTESKSELAGKIKALLADMELHDNYADGIAKQMFKREKVEWCDTKELHSIVVALIKKQRKQGGVTP